MAKLHYCAQYSDAYDRLRLGMPTSSKFDKIITPLGKPSKSWKDYAYHLIAETLLGRPIDSYTSEHMERGLALEEDAAGFYEMMTDTKVSLIGFVTNDAGDIGCSPDRLVGDDGLLEIKCPKPQTQVKYLLTGEVDKEYWPQLQGQLYVTGRQWVDIISYHPELPPSIIRVERDIEFIACLEVLLREFNNFKKAVIDKIQAMKGQAKAETGTSTHIQY